MLSVLDSTFTNTYLRFIYVKYASLQKCLVRGENRLAQNAKIKEGNITYSCNTSADSNRCRSNSHYLRLGHNLHWEHNRTSGSISA